jgi:ATP-binding cassette subfamily B (MDR/TAP) protein 1
MNIIFGMNLERTPKLVIDVCDFSASGQIFYIARDYVWRRCIEELHVNYRPICVCPSASPYWLATLRLIFVRLYMVYLFIGRVILAYVAILGFRISSLRISAAIRLSYLSALFQQPISVLDALPPGQTAAIITVTANILQLGISERLSSLIQAISVICTALVIGCIYSWTLTLATSSGLVLIVAWYAVLTPVTVKKHQRSQEVEREASGVASEALGAIRMVAACGAEDKMSKSYNELVDQVKELGHKMSPIISLQHSPGMS